MNDSLRFEVRKFRLLEEPIGYEDRPGIYAMTNPHNYLPCSICLGTRIR